MTISLNGQEKKERQKMIDITKDRETYVGGSEIAAVMGLSRWDTPLSVWAQKTGKIVKDLSGIEAVEMGTDLEPFVAKKFEERSGKKVRVDQRHFIHPDYPYMAAHIDRWVLNEDGAILEAKTCSAYKANEWSEDEIPNEYYLQVNWYSGIVALHREEKPKDGYIAVLIGGQKFVWKPVEFSQKLFDRQVEVVRDFWENFVLTDTPPMATSDDKDSLLALHPESEKASIRKIEGETSEHELLNLCIQRNEGKGQIKEIIKEVDEAENLLRQMIGDDEGIESGQWIASWKSQNTTSVNTQAMKDDGVYEKYAKRGTTRVLRVKAK